MYYAFYGYLGYQIYNNSYILNYIIYLVGFMKKVYNKFSRKKQIQEPVETMRDWILIEDI